MKDLTINELAQLNNLANIKRGKISAATTMDAIFTETNKGICEEFSEFRRASATEPSEHLPQYSQMVEELTDMMITCACAIERLRVDVQQAFHDKVMFNCKRND